MEKTDNFRHEFKYRCDVRDIEVLKNRLKGLLKLDSHAQNGIYEIRSIYFDNCYGRCFFENENGVDCREKFRIRAYNRDPRRISLECKRKERGKTLKISTLISQEQFYDIMDNKNLSINSAQDPLLNKFIYLIKTQRYRPSVIVGYDRIPYVYTCGNVRVTVDMNIYASHEYHNFFEADCQRQNILPSGQHIIEVKYDELLPDFIKTNLEMIDLKRTTFSKYYLCKKFSSGGLL